MFLRSNSTSQENNTSFLNSKETNIINNNLGNMKRVFGTEISNIQYNATLKDKKTNNSKLSTQSLSLKNSVNCSSQPQLIIAQNAKSSEIITEELTETTKDPLLLNTDISILSEVGDQKQPPRCMNVEAFDIAERIAPDFSTMEECDIADINNPQCISQYAVEIFEYLRSIEEKYSPNSGYMAKIQTDINEKMRAILIDWLIDVHLKFKLLPETLFLTVNIIDRYLERVPVMRQKLQLVGVTAMLIACKYEEIYPPEVKDFVYVTDKAYSREEVLETEGHIISALNFNLTTPSSFRFLERYSRLINMDQKAFNLCRYVLELGLIEYRMLKYNPSLLACGSIYLCNKLCKKAGWNEVLERNCKYDENTVKQCAKDLLVLLRDVDKVSLQAVKRKFSSGKYHEVAKARFEKQNQEN